MTRVADLHSTLTAVVKRMTLMLPINHITNPLFTHLLPINLKRVLMNRRKQSSSSLQYWILSRFQSTHPTELIILITFHIWTNVVDIIHLEIFSLALIAAHLAGSVSVKGIKVEVFAAGRNAGLSLEFSAARTPNIHSIVVYTKIQIQDCFFFQSVIVIDEKTFDAIMFAIALIRSVRLITLLTDAGQVGACPLVSFQIVSHYSLATFKRTLMRNETTLGLMLKSLQIWKTLGCVL